MPHQHNRRCVTCGSKNIDIETRDGRLMCWRCASALNYCEICGSTLAFGEQDPDKQLHFEEECFK